mgnify:CR=1 FL=1
MRLSRFFAYLITLAVFCTFAAGIIYLLAHLWAEVAGAMP